MIPVVPPKPKKKSKDELQAESNKFKKAIETQIDNMAEKGIKIGKTTLIAGGLAFAGYIIFDALFGRTEKKKNKAFLKIDANKLPEKKKSSNSWIVTSIKGYILAFIIGIAREKIVEALAELKKDETKQNI